MPAGLHWFRVAVASATDAVCRLLGVAAQAMSATSRVPEGMAIVTTDLPAGTITKLDVPDAAVKAVSQPYPTFGGRPVEDGLAFATRVSERLRHKDRAITLWDYEHLVLEAFPGIYQARCLNHTLYDPTTCGAGDYNELAPGHVTVVTIPDLAVPNPRDPLRPYTSLRVLGEIDRFLRARMSCFATLHVRNPQFEEVRVALRVRLRDGVDETFHLNRLRQEITEFLSPWAFRADARPQFNGTVHSSVLVNFIEERPYVDYVTDVELFRRLPDALAEEAFAETVVGSRAISILVSAPAAEHTVVPIPAGAGRAAARGLRLYASGSVAMTISPLPQPGMLAAAHDFYRLRREGIGHLQQAGSDNWTDYNTHDPGISILEALAYAITDLAYRTGFPIEDLLSSGTSAASTEPYPGQTFYPARQILTVNPTTAEDFRRLLIDVDPVRNAWVRCKACACDTPLFAWCEEGALVVSDDPSQREIEKTTLTPVTPRGLYDVLLELEAVAGLGDLNDRKIVRRRSVEVAGQYRPYTVEVRFPAWPLARRDERQVLADDDQPLNAVTVAGPNNTTTGTTPVTDAELRRHWFDVLYVDFDVELADTTHILIENASVRLYGDSSVRGQATVADLLDWLDDETTEGFVESYRRKLGLTDDAILAAREALEAHRNLDEDYCHLSLVEIDDIAVCVDVEVAPTADIELVQAQLWFEIERYLDPPVDFWSLQELLAKGVPVEEIFNGPELHNGFLTADGLAASDLRTELRVSDIINRISDIDGVVSVANLLLTAYDTTGNPIAGIADPTWHNGVPEFDPARTSAAWLLYPSPDHRTRLHHALSAFTFTSRGLPFLPRLDEAEATLVQLHGQAARPKLLDSELDLPVPLGTSRALESYQPIQHSFPLTYGIGPAGLPSTATPQRRAQATQLKGYLMVYEQLLRNGYAQLAHAGDLFSLDPGISATYFSGLFDGTLISGYDDLVDSLDAAGLQQLVETATGFTERRNRFLDHLLARFGESFGEYAMALTDLEGQTRARADLIHDKLSFLRAMPRISHDRGKAINRSTSPCDPDNASGPAAAGHPAARPARLDAHLSRGPVGRGARLHPHPRRGGGLDSGGDVRAPGHRRRCAGRPDRGPPARHRRGRLVAAEHRWSAGAHLGCRRPGVGGGAAHHRRRGLGVAAGARHRPARPAPRTGGARALPRDAHRHGMAPGHGRRGRQPSGRHRRDLRQRAAGHRLRPAPSPPGRPTSGRSWWSTCCCVPSSPATPSTRCARMRPAATAAASTPTPTRSASRT